MTPSSGRREPWQEALLAEGRVFLVGGAVRDRLLSRSELPDRDYLVTGVPFPRLAALLREHGHVDAVGSSFGVLKFRAAGAAETVDVALPRRDRSTGEGHKDFEVDFDPHLPVEIDLGRRDFTVNAMAWDVATGELLDPLGGRRDLDARLLRMTYPGSFLEDPLRMLRGVVFAARFGMQFESKTWEALRSEAPRLDTVSRERVRDEFVKLLTLAPVPSVGFRLLLAGGLLARILPELARGAGVEQNEHHRWDVLEHGLRTLDALAGAPLPLLLAGLLHDVGKVDCRREVREEGEARVVFYGHEKSGAELAERTLRRLRFPERTLDRAVLLVGRHMFDYQPEWTDAAVRRLISGVGEDAVDDLLRLRFADRVASGTKPEDPWGAKLAARVRREVESRHAFRVSDLAIGGEEVMEALGSGPGPEVGRALAWLLERVLEDPARNEPAELRRLLRELPAHGEAG